MDNLFIWITEMLLYALTTLSVFILYKNRICGQIFCHNCCLYKIDGKRINEKGMMRLGLKVYMQAVHKF